MQSRYKVNRLAKFQKKAVVAKRKSENVNLSLTMRAYNASRRTVPVDGGGLHQASTDLHLGKDTVAARSAVQECAETRQAAYVSRNIEAHSCNHYCSKKQ